MNKINPNNHINLTLLVEMHREKYSKEYMQKRFKKHSSKADLDFAGDEPEERKRISEKYKRFFQYLLLKIEDIVGGRPEALQLIIEHIETNFRELPFSATDKTGDGQQTNLYKTLVRIFNYEGFSNAKEERDWGAYRLASLLNTAVCPYCDRQYIHTHFDETLKIRATLDHFYDKGTYPFLSISFYNLIPSCYYCNSVLKHTKSFSIKTHANPYLCSFDGHMDFFVGFRKGDGKQQIDYTGIMQADPEAFTIGFRSRAGSDVNLSRLMRRNIHDFKLRELYKVHKDYVSEIIHKSVVYNEAFIKTLLQAYPELFSSEEEISRIVLGNYIQPQDQGRRVLSKLTRDIAEQFKLTERLSVPVRRRHIRRLSVPE